MSRSHLDYVKRDLEHRVSVILDNLDMINKDLNDNDIRPLLLDVIDDLKLLYEHI